jgi:uncharacterized protein YjbJ (UPF0337 family)
MNTLKLNGSWNEIAGKLKQRFAVLTDDDLLFKEGKEDEMIGRLQQKLGKTKQGILRLIAKMWSIHEESRLTHEISMKYLHLVVLAGSVRLTVVFVGCGSSPAVNKEASSSAIRAAEEVGAAKVPSASLYLQLAKEESESARVLAAKGEREQAESMLTRSQVDGELALALSRSEEDKAAATKATEQGRQLQLQNSSTLEERK